MNVGRFYVTGLAPGTSSESLQQYFQQFGEIIDVAIADQDPNLRYAVVSFADAGVAAYLLAQRHFIDAKEVEVMMVPAQQELAATANTNTRPKKIFVGGLAPTTTKEALAAYFGRFGTLEDYVVMVDVNGVSRCFGFVTFASPEEADTVFDLPNHLIDGKQVECKRAEPRGSVNLLQRAAYGQAPQYPAYAGYQIPQAAPAHVQQTPQTVVMRGDFYNPATTAPQRAPTALDYYQTAPYGLPRMGPGATENPHSYGAKLFVGGLSQVTTEESMAAYFSHFGYVVAVEVMRREDRSRGFGFVVFQADQEAYLALQHLPHIIDGKTVECKACSPKTAEPPPKRARMPVFSATDAYGLPGYDPMRQRYRPYQL